MCIDGGILPGGGAGLGVVFRDDGGNFLLAAGKKIKGSLEVEIAEALAAEMGAQLAHQFSFMDIEMDVDCLIVVHRLQNPNATKDEVTVVCRNTCRQLEMMRVKAIRHISRDANKGAHLMAHVETRWNEPVIWVERPPVYLVDQLQLDNVTAVTDQ
ncbi:unnamed protein product [Linum trigynum]|uniref:RNase H type-1 domain-containing protein n=1 Tax=Linum trigynum TaxID=586398 RepID=A0AAV2CV07_9ROSI